jgi:hypothetical protein
MNHLPFENWLLTDEILDPAQKRELDAHLRECVNCARLAETGLALRSAKVISPAAGFAARFEKRLAAQRVADRRRRLIGLLVFVLGGAGLLTIAGGATIMSIFSSPAEWLAAGVGTLLFIFTSLQVLAEMTFVLADVLPGLLPPLAWMMIISAVGGASLLWTVSIWRFTTRQTQGVTS